jgi:hypothetical protein
MMFSGLLDEYYVGNHHYGDDDRGPDGCRIQALLLALFSARLLERIYHNICINSFSISLIRVRLAPSWNMTRIWQSSKFVLSQDIRLSTTSWQELHP